MTHLQLSDIYFSKHWWINANNVFSLGKKFVKNIGWDAKEFWDNRTTYVKYKLNGDYRTLKMTLGLDDESRVGASGEFRVYLDGEEKYKFWIEKGEKPRNVTIDVTGGNTLKVEYEAGSEAISFLFIGDTVLYK
ncbi:NPCBM/NEW2 domain-containing protein [Caldicellulosiruptor acetigenus]|uniref:NPCBM/NEW2 domain-containing protein n=1 Tax=Caldicellulosiruptor acetigenus TaxID=301953 RepID=UPI0001E9A19A|nr:NPCBM/NEW2 domain-containing protein [Caldicellulosiruptor acetigenus]